MKWFFRNPISRFAWLSAFFGLAFILFIPPFQGPDEFTHFSRSYEVGSFLIAHRQHGKKVDLEGSFLPKSLMLTYDKTRLYKTPHYPDVPQAQKYFLNQTRDALHIPLNKGDKQFYDTGASPAYVPLLYVPQAIVIKVLEVMGAPIIVMLYLTRLACLALWIGLGVLALKKLKTDRLKLGISSLLLLPMFISQATVPGTDALLTGVTLLYFIKIYNSLHGKIILTTKQYFWLIILLFVMVMAKPVYLVFGLLMLLQKTKYKTPVGLIYKSLGTMSVAVVYAVWSYVTRYRGGPVYINSIDAAHAAPGTQLHYLIPNVFNFIEPLSNTLFLGWGDSTLVSLIGTFGLLDTPLPLLFVILGYTLILITVFATDEENVTHSKRQLASWAAFLLAIVYIGGVLFSMYVISTPPRTAVITGVQGRYFLPVLLLLAVYLPKPLLVNKRTLTIICAALPLILLTASIVVVWLRYYLLYPR